MSPDEISTLVDNIVNGVNEVADFAGALDPALLPFLAIGKAIDRQIPGLSKTIANLIEGNPATEADKADLLQQLSVLGNPNLP